MLAGWKTLDAQNNFLTIDLSEEVTWMTVRLLDGYSRETETGHLLG